jgi:hypothetical protein
MEMVISRITAQDVLAGCRQALGLPVDQDALLDDVLLASLLRRSAGIHCPCSRATLRTSLVDSLQYVTTDEKSLSSRIDAGIDALIVGGDLLELNDVVTEDTAARGTWVFAAPPGFVVRPSGVIFIFGIVPDQDAFLPGYLSSRITYRGLARVVASRAGEDLAAELREHGLQQLSESAWLKSPKVEAAADLLKRYQGRLAAQPPAGTISGLEILDPAHPVTFYPGRWVVPKNQCGDFVGRRPQEFGAPLWCFVALEGGRAVRLLDLPLKQTRWRGCDAAWRLQMAIDYCGGVPQRYRRRAEGGRVRLDFFSPLPQWSERRLMVFGRPVPRQKSLMSYCLPAAEAQVEERFLENSMWLSRTEDWE